MFIHRFAAIFALALLPSLSCAQSADLLRQEFPSLSFERPAGLPRPEPAAAPEQSSKSKKQKPSASRKSGSKTPAQLLGAYMPRVKSALASRWADAVTKRMAEFSPGNTSLTFKLDAEGKVTVVVVTANTSNEPFAIFCDQFVRETKFQPPPAGALSDGLVEIPFTFTIY